MHPVDCTHSLYMQSLTWPQSIISIITWSVLTEKCFHCLCMDTDLNFGIKISDVTMMDELELMLWRCYLNVCKLNQNRWEVRLQSPLNNKGLRMTHTRMEIHTSVLKCETPVSDRLDTDRFKWLDGSSPHISKGLTKVTDCQTKCPIHQQLRNKRNEAVWNCFQIDVSLNTSKQNITFYCDLQM